MPQKKKEGLGSDKSVVELQADHELFLQAFEKPTQIYRFLRSRNLISPIFLQRTLYYMKDRMSRNQKNRSAFKIDNLLNEVQLKTQGSNNLPGTFLNIIYTGFHDKKLESSVGDIARVETYIVKISHKKRKEATAPLTHVSVGTQDVLINPSNEDALDAGHYRNNTLSIPTHHFSPSNGHQIKSFLLVFRVSIVHDQENAGEPAPKRRRISRNASQENSQENITNNHHTSSVESTNGHLTTELSGGVGTCYGAELVVYDRHGRCQLTPGQYEILVEPLQSRDVPPPGKISPKKNAVWENFDSIKMDESPFHTLNNSPVLKFDLAWTEDVTPLCNDKSQKSRPLQPLDIALTNKLATKPKPQGVSSPEAPQLVLYQFIYNNNGRQQTEARRDFHCPWCSLKCLNLYSLLKHLKLGHARFSFTYVPHPKGARIDVSLNECYDGSYSGNPQDLVAMPSGYAFNRTGPTRRSPNTAILVCLPKRQRPSLSEFLEQDDNDFDLPRSYILGHNRLYHHTTTCLPVQPHELDEDSEGEHDTNWVRTKTQMMIDEFSDVNEGEKEVTKMWNLHVMKHNYVGDGQLPLACYMFVEIHGRAILARNLYRNLVLHLSSLHDFGLIGAGVMYTCISNLQECFEDDDMKKSLSQHWEQQKRNSKKAFQSPTHGTPKSNIKYTTGEWGPHHGRSMSTLFRKTPGKCVKGSPLHGKTTTSMKASPSGSKQSTNHIYTKGALAAKGGLSGKSPIGPVKGMASGTCMKTASAPTHENNTMGRSSGTTPQLPSGDASKISARNK